MLRTALASWQDVSITSAVDNASENLSEFLIAQDIEETDISEININMVPVLQQSRVDVEAQIIFRKRDE